MEQGPEFARVLVHVTSGIDIARADRDLKRARFEVAGGNYLLGLGR